MVSLLVIILVQFFGEYRNRVTNKEMGHMLGKERIDPSGDKRVVMLLGVHEWDVVVLGVFFRSGKQKISQV